MCVCVQKLFQRNFKFVLKKTDIFAHFNVSPLVEMKTRFGYEQNGAKEREHTILNKCI